MSRELLQIKGRQIPHDVPERPDEVWLLPHGGEIPAVLQHHKTAFLEDEMHDWHWAWGQFYYHGAGGEGPCSLVLVFKEDSHDG